MNVEFSFETKARARVRHFPITVLPVLHSQNADDFLYCSPIIKTFSFTRSVFCNILTLPDFKAEDRNHALAILKLEMVTYTCFVHIL